MQDCTGQKWCGCDGIKKVDENQNEILLVYCLREKCTDIAIWVRNLEIEIWNHKLCLLVNPGNVLYNCMDNYYMQEKIEMHASTIVYGKLPKERKNALI